MVCTAARSEICDQRERGVHERRRSPKRTSLLRPTDARAARSVTARAASSARSGDPCPGPGMPPGVRPSLRHLFTLHDASRGRGGAGSIVGALEAQGLRPPEQINLCRLHRRRAERSAGHCDQVAAAHASRAAGIIAALAPLRRPQTRQSVAPPPRRCSRKILSCALVAQFIPSLRARPRSNYDCA